MILDYFRRLATEIRLAFGPTETPEPDKVGECDGCHWPVYHDSRYARDGDKLLCHACLLEMREWG